LRKYARDIALEAAEEKKPAIKRGENEYLQGIFCKE
jgi:hypothetical protein